MIEHQLWVAICNALTNRRFRQLRLVDGSNRILSGKDDQGTSYLFQLESSGELRVYKSIEAITTI